MGRALPRLLKSLFIAALIICSCSVCAKAILEGAVDTRNPLLEVTFLDIEGDATFIKTPGGRTILIDGGRKQIPSKLLSVLYEKLPPENTGPWRSAQRRIDVVVLTNPTPDHIGGLIQVLENDDIDVGQVIYPGIPYTSPAYKHFLSLVKENHIPYYMITGGEIFYFFLYNRGY